MDVDMKEGEDNREVKTTAVKGTKPYIRTVKWQGHEKKAKTTSNLVIGDTTDPVVPQESADKEFDHFNPDNLKAVAESLRNELTQLTISPPSLTAQSKY